MSLHLQLLPFCITTFIGFTFSVYSYEFFHKKDYADAFDKTFWFGVAFFGLWLNVWLFGK